jgi:phosphohistidine phosphatase SixA
MDSAKFQRFIILMRHGEAANDVQSGSDICSDLGDKKQIIN